MDPLLDKNLISTRSASKLSGYSADYLSRLLRAKDIQGTRIGRAWFVERNSLVAFIEAQAKHNKARARALARVRASEYREKARQPLAPRRLPLETLTPPAPAQATEPELAAPLKKIRVRFIYRPVVAGLVAVFVVSAGAYSAGSGAVAGAGERALVAVNNVAFGARLIANNFSAYAGGEIARVARSATGSAERAQDAVGSATDVAIIAPRAISAFAIDTTPVRAPALAIAEPSVPVQTTSSADVWRALGSAGLSLGTETRDAILNLPRAALSADLAFAKSIIGASQSILGWYDAGAFAWAVHSPDVARDTVLAVYDLGATTGDVAQQAPALAARGAVAAATGFNTASLALARGIIENEIAFGAILEQASTASAKLALRPFIATGVGLYEASEIPDSAALALQTAGRDFADLSLGAAGKTALAVSGARAQLSAGAEAQLSAPSYSLPERVALSTYETVSNLFGAGLRAVAFILAPIPPAALAPEIPSSVAPAPVATSSAPLAVAEPPAATHTTTYIAPQFTIAGADKTYVDTQIAILRGFVIGNIDSLADTIHNGGASGNSGGGSGSVTSIDASGGTTGLSFSGGPITSSGTLTLGGTLAVANGGTGTSTAPAYGELLLGNGSGGYDLVATSSLGISAGGNPSWGNIIGTLSDQTDLQNALNAKLSLSDWFSTTTAPQLTSLPNLVLPAGQISGALAVANGGTGTSTAPGYGQLLVGNGSGGYNLVATSSLGISGGGGAVDSVFGRTGAVTAQSGDYTTAQVTESGNLYYTDARARSALSSSATGLSYATSTGVFSLTSGYTIPLIASTTDWNTAFLDRITSASSPLSISSNVLSLGTVGIANGGTGTTTAPSLGQLLIGNNSGGYNLVSTSSLGLQPAGSYESPLTFTYPLTRSTNTISLAFGTTTSNTWAGTQTFTNAPILGALTGLIYGNAGTLGTTSTSTASLGSGLSYTGTLGALVGGANGTLSVAGLTTSNFSSANISQWTNDAGYLTGNQTITLSGDITGSGATSITTSYNNVVPANKGGAGTVSGILKANGSGTVSAATAGTDYAPATSGSSLLYGNGSGGFSSASVSSPLSFSGGALSLGTVGIANGGTGTTTGGITGGVEYYDGSKITNNASFYYNGSGQVGIGTNSNLNGSLTLSGPIGTQSQGDIFREYDSGDATWYPVIARYDTVSSFPGGTYIFGDGANANVGIEKPGGADVVSFHVHAASTTLSDDLIVGGQTTLATSLTGVLKAAAGVVSAGAVDLASDVSGVLPQGNGGTGIDSYNPGDILYADGSGNLTTLPVGSSGTVLKVSGGGAPFWGTDLTSGGGGGAGAWATTSDSLAIYPTDTSNVVIVGSNSTSSASSIFEVHGNQYLSGNLGIGTTSPFTKLSVAGNAYVGGNLTATGTVAFTGLGSGLVKSTSGTLGLATDGTDYVSPTTFNTLFDNRLSATTSLPNITTLGNLADVGTITSGVWQGTAIDVAHGGTGNTSWTNGSIPYFDGTKLTEDNSNLYWDEGALALGIDTTPSGSAALEVNGDFGFTSGADHTLSILAPAGNANGNSLSIAAGNAHTTGTAKNGGDLYLDSGSAAGIGGTNGTIYLGANAGETTEIDGPLNLFGGTVSDSFGSPGSNGNVLTSTGSGVEWVATSSLGFLSSAVTSLKQTYGATQTGAITLATSSSATNNGVTVGQTITNSSGTFTFTPTVSVSSIPNSALANATISGIALGANLDSLSHDSTLSGTSYNGSATVSDWGLNLGNANTWTGLQQFNGNASTTGFTNSGSTWLTGLTSALLSTDSSGKIVATTTLGGNISVPAANLTGAVAIANGGTGTTTGGVTNGVEYFDGSKITNNTTLTYNASSQQLSVEDSSAGNLTSALGSGYLDLTDDSDSNNPSIYLERAGGTAASRTAVTNGMTLGELGFGGWQGSGPTGISANISAAASQDWSSGNAGTDLIFSTIANGSGLGSQREVARLTNGGNFGIGTTSPFATLSVGGNTYLGGSLTATGTVAFTGLGSGLVKSTSGTLSVATAGTDYLAPGSLSATYPIQYSANTFSLAFGTTTSNTWAGTQTFTNPIAVGSGSGTSTFNGNIGVTGNVVPSADNTYTLGDVAHAWKEVYIGPGSLYVNGQEVVHTNGSDDVVISANTDQNIQVKPLGTGNIQLAGPVQITGGKTFTTTDSSAVLFSDGVKAGNLTVDGNEILASNLNGGISLTPNGNGGVYVTTGNLGIGTTSPFALLSVAGNSYLGGNLTATGTVNFTGLGSGLVKSTSGVLSVASAGTDYAPATSGSSILKGNGSGGFSNASAGTDYAPATSGSSILYGNGSGGFSNASVSSPLSFSGGALSLGTVGIANGGTGTTTGGITNGVEYYDGSKITNGTGFVFNGTNVGIGTTSPWKALSVAGDLSVTGQIYDSTGSAGTGGAIFTSTGSGTEWIATSSLGLGTGSVTSVDVSGGTTGLTTSGGPITGAGTITLAGTLNVANGGTGTTSLSGILKGNGTSAITAAVAGTDYAPATSGSGILRGNGAGGFSNVSVISPLSYSGGALSLALLGGSGVDYDSGSGTISLDYTAHNIFSGLQEFDGNASSTQLSALSAYFGTTATTTIGADGKINTPGLTIGSLSGLLKASSGVVSAATAGTDYAPATSGSSLLYGNGSGGFSSASVSSPLSFSGGALSLGTVGIANGGTGTTTGGTLGGIEFYDGSKLTNSPDFTYATSTGGIKANGFTSEAGYGVLEDGAGAGYYLGSGSALEMNVSDSNAAIAGGTGVTDVDIGQYNLAVGDSALGTFGFPGGGGSGNVAVGAFSNTVLAATTTTAVGFVAGAIGDSDIGSVYLGAGAGFNTIAGAYNTLLGFGAGSNITTGTDNIIIGADSSVDPLNFTAGTNGLLSSGSNNIAIGYDISLPSATASNQLDIGNLIYGTSINGTGSTLSTGNIGIGTTSPFAKLSVAGTTYLGGNLTATGTIAFTGLGSGLVKSTSGTLSIASAGTDYAPATSGSSILYGNGSGGFSNVSVGSGLSFSGGTLSATGGGGGLSTTSPWTTGNLAFVSSNSAVSSVATSSLAVGSEFTYSGTLGALVGGANGTLTLTNNGVALGKIATIAANSILGNPTGSTGNVQAIATSSLGIALSDTTGTLAANRGGTGQASYTTGDILYASGSTALSKLSDVATGAVLASGGTGTAPAWSTSPSISGTLTVGNAIDSGLTTDTLAYANGSKQFASATVSSPLSFSSGTLSLGTVGFGNGGTGNTATLSAGSVIYSDGSKLTQDNSNFYYDASNHRLGLGTTTPAGHLAVQTPTNEAKALSVSNSAGTTTLELDTLDTAGNLFSVATSTGVDYFDIAAGGNVGIGTTSPFAKLSIAGNAYVGGNLTATGTVTLTGLSSGLVKSTSGVLSIASAGTDYAPATSGSSILYGNGSGGFSNVTIGSGLTFSGGTLSASGGSGTVTSVNASGGTTGLTFSGGPITTSGTLTLAGTLGIANGGTGTTTGGITNGIEYYDGSKLTNSGNFVFNGTKVGIGTTTPGWLLSLSGTTGEHIKTTSDITGALAIENSSGTNVFQVDTANSPTAIFTVATSTGNTYFTVGASGNIGIATTTPWATLSVSGQSGVNALAISTSSDSATALRVSANGNLHLANGAGIDIGNGVTPPANGLLVKGNVGIGSTSPSTLLTVEGNTPIVSLSNTAVSGRLWQVRAGSAAAGTLDIYDATGAASRLAINSSGEVFVGATAETLASPSGNLLYVANSGTFLSNLRVYGNLQLADSGTGNVMNITSGDNSSFTAIRSLTIDLNNGNRTLNLTGNTTLNQDVSSTGDPTFALLNSRGDRPVCVTGNSSGNPLAATANASGCLTGSDERLKTNITSLGPNQGLAAVMQLNPVSYYWKDPSVYGDGTEMQVGFVAQQVEPVLPNLVGTTSPTVLTPDVTYALGYQGFIPIAINAIKELAEGYTLNNLGSNATSTIASFYQGTSTPAITVDAAGNVGIGKTAPAHTLDVNGDVAAISFVNTSTKSAKTNISYLDASSTADILDEINSLKIAQYRYKIEPASDPLRLGLIAEDAATEAPQVLSPDGKGVDIYKLATFDLAGIQAVSSKIDALSLRMDSLESRIAKLESDAVGDATSTSVFSTSTLAEALQSFGVAIENGIAQFGTLVAKQFVAATDDNGQSSAGSGTILAGNTVVEIDNAYAEATSKILITMTSPVDGNWYLSDKEDGKFRVTLSQTQAADVTFDYFIIETKGQIAGAGAASSTPSTDSGQATSTTDGVTRTNTITIVGTNPDGTDTSTTTVVSSTDSTSSPQGTSTPPAQDTGSTTESTTTSATSTPAAPQDTTAPVVSLNGPAAIQVNVGDSWNDPGATATDDVDGDLTSEIVETGSVDSNTPGLYTLTYTATDSAGNSGHVSRVVTVKAATPAAPSDSGANSATSAPSS